MNATSVIDLIEAGCADLDQVLPRAAAKRLAAVLAELSRWGRKVNLTTILDSETMVAAHVLDSLSIRPYLVGGRIIDLGTGAGFPGLPLAIAEPAREFVLLDSNRKKTSFVQHVIGELELPNVQVVTSRAEDYAPERRFDTVIARALAALPRIVALSEHLLRDGGIVLAQKGQYPAAELDGLREAPGNWDYEVVKLTVPGLDEHARHVVCLEKVGEA